MYNVPLTRIGVQTSALGMGCASLGSRVSAAKGQAALTRAWEAGVRWYDVAPAYGGGEAEALLGAFLKRQPGAGDTAHICTKVGLQPPVQTAGKKLLRAALRPVLGALPGLRSAIRKSGATANSRIPLSPELLRSSLENSLRRLGREQVTLYALHNASPEDLEREDILRTLEDLRRAGKTRAVAVAGGPEVALAACDKTEIISAVQLAQPGRADLNPLPQVQAAGLDVITHSVFGVAGELEAWQQRLHKDHALRARLADLGFVAPDGAMKQLAAQYLLARARASNPTGVILCSMYSPHSLTQNVKGTLQPPQDLPLTV